MFTTPPEPPDPMHHYKRDFLQARDRLLHSFTHDNDSKIDLTKILVPSMDRMPHDISSMILEYVSRFVLPWCEPGE